MFTQEENKIIAELLFPHRANITRLTDKTLEDFDCYQLSQQILTREDYEFFYLSKKRENFRGENSEIIRMAPSPTGEFHTGALYMSLLNKIIAKQTDGIYILRIEDTDQKREVVGAKEKFVDFLNYYDLNADEGFVYEDGQIKQKGDFGPYLQSQRKNIYESFTFDLILKGYAYPCFLSQADLIIMREEQEAMKVRTGVYGKYAKVLSFDEMISKITNKEDWVIRLNPKGNFENKIEFEDQFMGKLQLSDNDEHYIIYKSDGLPTYHFAHPVDDYLMGITFVTRANEWIPSLTKHLQMWNILRLSRSDYINNKFPSFKIPKYGHSMPINISEGNSVRKLSKRKDKEAILPYFDILGYTKESIIAYLLRLMAPTFDDWWKAGNRNVYDYDLNMDELKRNSRGPILDMVKLNSFSSDLLGEMSAEDITNRSLDWSKKYNQSFFNVINKDCTYLQKIMNIERGGDKPRKDIRHLSEIENNIFYFYDELYYAEDLDSKTDIKDYFIFKDKVKIDTEHKNKIIKIKELLEKENAFDIFFISNKLSLEDWITKIKSISLQCGYEKFGDFMMDVRLIISKKKNTPNMYYIFEVIDREVILNRFKNFLI